MPKGPRIRIALIGLGLIGGSVARALKRKGADRGGLRKPRIVAWSPSGTGPAAALAAGVVDEVAIELPAALADADLVVLAAPPLATLELLDWIAGPASGALGRDVTITDVASTKYVIVERARALGLPFVGGHPMAGREVSGFAGADPTLFVDRPWVVVGEGARAIDVSRVEWLAIACGARPLLLDAAAHDTAVAGISHLPLVVSAALAEAVAGDDRPAWHLGRRLAAGGWASSTRLALGDPTMGAGILATNAGAVAGRLRTYRAQLDEWLALLEGGNGAESGPDAARLEARLDGARSLLRGPEEPSAGG